MCIDAVRYQLFFLGRTGWRRQFDKNLVQNERLDFTLGLLFLSKPIEFGQPVLDR